MNDRITWSSATRKIAELNPAPYNPRYLTEKQAKDIAASIDEFGLADPIIINMNNVIIGGHQRINILKAQGVVQEVDVRVPSRLLTEPEERCLNLRLNKNIGSWDLDALANFNDEELLSVGFEAAELDNIFDLEPGKTGPDEIPAVPAESKAKQGQIYRLGEHRLMCGDSTDIEAVKRLVQGNDGLLNPIQMVFTDPPYNVNYKGKGENTSEGIENDHIDPAQFQEFIVKVFENMFQVMDPGAVFYICSGWSSYPVFNTSLVSAGLYRAGVIIWKKDNASYGWNDYRYKHEWILVGKRKEQRIKAVSMIYGWRKSEGGGRAFFQIHARRIRCMGSAAETLRQLCSSYRKTCLAHREGPGELKREILEHTRPIRRLGLDPHCMREAEPESVRNGIRPEVCGRYHRAMGELHRQESGVD